MENFLIMEKFKFISERQTQTIIGGNIISIDVFDSFEFKGGDILLNRKKIMSNATKEYFEQLKQELTN
jgi:hypothetical protein